MMDRDELTKAAAGSSMPRDERELTPATPSMTHSIAQAVVIKKGAVFFLSEPDGCVPLESGHGFGLYYHDCRFLNGYELRLSGKKPEALVHTSDKGFMSVLGMTNPDIRTLNGALLEKHNIEIKWIRIVDSDHIALHDVITFQNLTFRALDFRISFAFLAEFEDVFAIRGMPQKKRGTLRPAFWNKGSLNFVYEGADGMRRSLSIEFSPQPTQTAGRAADFQIDLPPRENKQILVSSFAAESFDQRKALSTKVARPHRKRVQSALKSLAVNGIEEGTQAHTDSLVLNRIVDRSLRDLSVLKSYVGEEEYFAAGVPWFVALFGRDSIITALQTLAFDPRIADNTIRLLAAFQGKQVDRWREEEPGRILHELRVGEMARLAETPHSPYYGTIDATPLFLILVARHAAWTGDLTIFNELRANIEAAIEWMSIFGDIDRDGYVKYTSNGGDGLINLGWKDSNDAIVNDDGSAAVPPIALVEVQSYVYAAKMECASLYRWAGEAERANHLEQEAGELREKFNKDFWVEPGFFALALQRDRVPAAVVSSNAGHTLWSGIAERDKAESTVERLMADDMFNGWGIRTLSEKERKFNPLGYHLGTVWPHDNSLILAGFRRYGFDSAALRVFVGLIEAAVHFEEHRLPELFGGFARADYSVPVIYPVACRPQAWAAGAVPYMLTSLLGITPEAFEHRLRITRPVMPEFVNRIELRGLRIGAAEVDLKFERTPDCVAVKALRLNRGLDVIVEL